MTPLETGDWGLNARHGATLWDMVRPDPPFIPLAADERETLASFLDYYRAALVDRTLELSMEQLRERHPPSRLTLAALLGHMARVELIWFRQRLDGEVMPEPFASLDYQQDQDADMTAAENWSLDELYRHYNDAVGDSRSRVAMHASLDDMSLSRNREDENWSLRWILIHMIEEYARHCGHADLIREAIDGDTAS